MADDVENLADQIKAGDRRALAKGITLVESSRADHRQQASALLDLLMPFTGESLRLGISGAPGVGKSTFIEALGNHLVEAGHSVAVLAVDPSSALTGGSILGDKTRMESFAFSDQAFVRPSPAGKTLGGVARRTRESMLVCEAAGFDIVLVETVGVGQSETAVADMTDMFLVLLLPSGGDELQGIKRGIMELADLIIVNKADGDQVNVAQQTMADYRSALHFLTPRSVDWQPSVMTCSSLTHDGVSDIWSEVTRFKSVMTAADTLQSKRASQSVAWMWQEIAETLLAEVKGSPQLQSLMDEMESSVRQGRVAATVAAESIIRQHTKSK